MIEINGNNYKLCLLDTNILSYALLNFKEFVTQFKIKYDESFTVICFSAFTISEIQKRSELLEKFANIFSQYPALILDGHESLFIKEKNMFLKREIVDPILFCTHTFDSDELYTIITDEKLSQRTSYWKDNREYILDGILNLKSNFESKENKFSNNEIEEFITKASVEQIAKRDIKFVKKALGNNQTPMPNDFPSIKAQAYCVFYKFYTDNRKPILSDIYDILIFSSLPYVDYFVTESNLSEHIKQIQNRHKELKNLQVYSIKDFK